MNEFEKRINALRLQCETERKQIYRDYNRTMGHLNTDLGKVKTQEARDALRAERTRVWNAAQESRRISRLCYLQQLELLNEEYRLWLEKNPSNHELRRMAAAVYKAAEKKGMNTITIYLGKSKQIQITFG